MRATEFLEVAEALRFIERPAARRCAVLADLPAGPLAQAAAVGIRAFDASGAKG